MLKPLRDWSVSDITYIGWTLVVLVSMLTLVLPVIPLAALAGSYCIVGLVKLYKMSVTALSLTSFETVGVAFAWPLALRANVFKR